MGTVQPTPQPSPEEPPVPSFGLLYITQAYNRKEITLEEWLRLALAWAEALLRQHELTKLD